MTVKKLIDPQGRLIHKLRLSLLDACNLRCLYCMPEEASFMDKSKLLSSLEIKQMCASLVSLGIDEIRLTGGEPTLRADLLEIVEELSKLPLKKLALTSNGIRTKELLPRLKKTNCHYLNFSLDSLNRKNFSRVTGRDRLEEVIVSILSAKEMGFNVKVNMVVMNGVNEHELKDFVRFSASHNIEVRFLELMRIGIARDQFNKKFISAQKMIELFKKSWSFEKIEMPIDSTSFNYKLDNGANIGFIASESRPFCGGCSRMRVGADGKLRPCLMVNDGVSIKNKSKNEIEEILHKVMALKPIDRIFDVDQGMYQIGG